MSDKKETSLGNEDFGMGMLANGKLDIFPASELSKRVAERNSDERATTYAMEQSELDEELRDEDDDETEAEDD